ncbi:MAG: YkvA family protein [Cyanobacteriota bacterium]|nr:YkvA family protein [Cyanobacteriota bacterium]
MSFSIESMYGWYRSTIRNPKYRWWVILGTFAYLLSPIDFVPDFIPIAGQVDDIALVTLMVAEVSQMAIEYFKSRQASKAKAEADSEKSTVDVDATVIS